MARILLVRPPSSIPVTPLPLGLMYLASCCRDRHTVRIVDLRVLPPDALDCSIKEMQPDIVGIGCMSAEATQGIAVAMRTKAARPTALVVMGGPHTNTFPRETIACEQIDALVHGEGELTFLEIADGTPLESVSGISYRTKGGIVTTPIRQFIEDIDRLPMPAYDLIDLEQYFSNPNVHGFVRKHARHAQLFTSRGCPYGCSYCHNVFGKRFRPRSAASVLHEIRHLATRYGIREIHIEDDAFNVDMSRAKCIMRMIIEQRLGIALSFPNGIRLDRLDEELAELMRQAGVYQISLGIESGDDEIQRRIGKGLDLTKAEGAIGMLASRGIIVNGFFMMGFLNETREQMDRTAAFIVRSRLHFCTIHKVSPFPGTRLYDEAHAATGLTVRMQDINEDEYRFGTLNVSAIPLEDLRLVQRRTYLRFYANPLRLWRIWRLAPNRFTLIRHFVRLLLWK